MEKEGNLIIKLLFIFAYLIFKFGKFSNDDQMKIIPVLLLITAFGSSCRNAAVKPSEGMPSSIEFSQTTHNFGIIPLGGDGTCEFEFTNTSEVPLVINMVKTSCGCTSPDWPKDPFEPGKKGHIRVKYNTNIAGSFYKSVTVYSNAKNSPAVLFIAGKVMQEKKNKKN